LLQIADFLMTCRVLTLAGGYEVNFFARSVLDQYGWGGLALYKFGSTVVFLAAVVLVSRRRALLGAQLLAVCCLVMAGVVGYSVYLLGGHAPTDTAFRQALGQQTRLNGALNALCRFRTERDAVCRRLLADPLSFPHAVAEMARCIERHRGALARAHVMPPTDRPVHVAVYLVVQAGRVAEHDPRLRPRLAAVRATLLSRHPQLEGRDMTPQTGVAPLWSASVDLSVRTAGLDPAESGEAPRGTFRAP
jgi:hypothetical protein